MDDQEYTGVFNADSAHTDESPWCSDMGCYCHEDTGSMDQAQDYIDDGLLTAQEADNLYHGRTV